MINATGNRMTREIARQSKLAEQIEKLQIQVSTGKRLQRMSDDVVASKRIATIGKTQAAMKARGVLVKNVSAMHPLLAQCLRLTVGTREENAQMLAALKESL